MIRLAVSIVIGFMLMFLQGYLVMRWNGYTSIAIAYPSGLLAVWLINSALSFSLLSQLKPWIHKRMSPESKS